MSATIQKRVPVQPHVVASQTKTLNAETVTAIATNFLRRIGNKRKLKPKKASLKDGIYTAEIEMKKLIALVRIDAETHEIKEYEIQPKSEEVSSVLISTRTIGTMLGVSAILYVAFHYLFNMLGI